MQHVVVNKTFAVFAPVQAVRNSISMLMLRGLVCILALLLGIKL